jgi:hypothetical protein
MGNLRQKARLAITWRVDWLRFLKSGRSWSSSGLIMVDFVRFNLDLHFTCYGSDYNK